MKIIFLGTRGYIEPSTRRHRFYTSALVEYRGRRVMIDAGKGWEARWDDVGPEAIVITHAHPDHAFALRDAKPPCPVFATEESWEVMGDFAVPKKLRHTLAPRRVRAIAGIDFEPFPVIHSTRAPAVGYRIRAGRVTVFYVPDVVWIHDREEAFAGIRTYIGDGATIKREMIRKDKESGELIGHSTIAQQLTWCRKEGVEKMIVTHCGADIVGGDERKVGAELRKLADERGVAVEIAHDGMEKVFR
ncbi:MAG TPA: MBL fold metallo-hydrolase [Wenzhouxiangellaceae bacterium]|nr:MBL fold metallo-hydrolase [Wenzhouxiangellaceae bacterium]